MYMGRRKEGQDEKLLITIITGRDKEFARDLIKEIDLFKKTQLEEERVLEIVDTMFTTGGFYIV